MSYLNALTALSHVHFNYSVFYSEFAKWPVLHMVLSLISDVGITDVMNRLLQSAFVKLAG